MNKSELHLQEIYNKKTKDPRTKISDLLTSRFYESKGSNISRSDFEKFYRSFEEAWNRAYKKYQALQLNDLGILKVTIELQFQESCDWTDYIYTSDNPGWKVFEVTSEFPDPSDYDMTDSGYPKSLSGLVNRPIRLLSILSKLTPQDLLKTSEFKIRSWIEIE